jgi:hypothetical protein
MEHIIFERADVRELASELVRYRASTDIDLVQYVYDNWWWYAAPIEYVNGCTDAAYICPSHLAVGGEDYVNRYHTYFFDLVKKAIDTILEAMEVSK